MSAKLDELLVLLATDAEMARSFEQDPAGLATRFELDPDEVVVLSAVKVERTSSRPLVLEERLSRSGMGFGAALHGALQGGDSGGDSGGDDGGDSGGSDKGGGDEGGGEKDSSDKGAGDEGSGDEGGGEKDGSDKRSGDEGGKDSGDEDEKSATEKAPASKEAPDAEEPPAADTLPTVEEDEIASRPATTQGTPAPDPAGRTDPATPSEAGSTLGPALQTPGHARTVSLPAAPSTLGDRDSGIADDPAAAPRATEAPGESAAAHLAATGAAGHDRLASVLDGQPWAARMHDAVGTALRGESLPSGRTQGEQMINQFAALVATAAASGPRGLPGAPWSANVAGFVLGALQVEPRSVAGSVAGASGSLPLSTAEASASSAGSVGSAGATGNAANAGFPTSVNAAPEAVARSVLAALNVDPTAVHAEPDADVETAVAPPTTERAALIARARETVIAVLRGDMPAPSPDRAEQAINQFAMLVAGATNAGPRGLPGVPWADEFARFVLGALRIDPATVTVPAASDPAPVGVVDTAATDPAVEHQPQRPEPETPSTEASGQQPRPPGGEQATVEDTVAPVTTPPTTTTPAAPDIRPPWAYRGRMIGQETISASDPHQPPRYRQFFADGSSRDVTFSNDDLGGSYGYTTADGTRITEYGSGDVRSLHVPAPDGSSVSFDWAGSRMTHTVSHGGESGGTTTIWSAPEAPAPRQGSELFRVFATEPGGRTDSYVTATLDGGAVARIEHGDTTQTVRLDVRETPNPDGTTTREYTFPDGRVEAFTFDAADHPVLHESTTGTPASTVAHEPGANAGYRGGVVGEQELTANPDGTTRVRLSYADGTSREVTRTEGEDGSVSDRYLTAEGRSAAEFENGDVGFYLEKDTDGTTTVHRQWIGTTMTERVHLPGGTPIDTTWSAAPPVEGEWAVGTDLYQVTNGGHEIRVSATADGGAVAHVRNGTVLATVRLEVGQVENADGTLTRLYTFPDGRTEAFTFDPDGRPVHHEAHAGTGDLRSDPAVTRRAATVDGGHHGEVVLHEVIDIDHLGTETVRQTFADGTVAEGTFSHETGFNTLTFADGTTVTGPSWGDAWSTTIRPDHTSTERTWDGLALTQVDRGRDGIVVHTSWGAPVDGEDLFRTEYTAPGAESVETRVSEAADGGAIATIRTGDATQTVRVAVEAFENADGTLTRVFVFPDGRTEAFTFDETGKPVFHEAHTGSGVVPSAHTVDPATTDDDHRGGVAREEVTGVDEHGRTTLTRTFADGTELEVQRVPVDPNDPAGAVKEYWTETDGTKVVQRVDGGDPSWSTTVGRDGASTLRGWEADGDLTQRGLNALGTTTTARVATGLDPEPGATILATTQTTATGLALRTTVVATADGGAMASAVRSDGAATMVRLAVREVDNVDGTRTRVFTFPDGRTESVTYDADGRPVGYEADSGLPPTATGPDASGRDDTEITTGPNGSRIETTTHPGDLTERVETFLDGSWTSVTTNAEGTVLTTSVGADGALIKRIELGEPSSDVLKPREITTVLARDYTTVQTVNGEGVIDTRTAWTDGRTRTTTDDPMGYSVTTRTTGPGIDPVTVTVDTFDNTTTTTTTTEPGVAVMTHADAVGRITETTSEMRNGHHVLTVKRPDGVTIEQETYENDAVKETVTDAKGIVTTTFRSPDGFASQKVTDPDSGAFTYWERSETGVITSEYLTKAPTSEGWVSVEGKQLVAEPGGRWVEHKYDHTFKVRTTTTYDPGDASAHPPKPASTTIETTSEHQSSTIVIRPDDTRVETITDRDGSVTTRNVAADGTWDAVKHDEATGHEIHTRLFENGTRVSTDVAPDGTAVTSTVLLDGRVRIEQDFGEPGYLPQDGTEQDRIRWVSVEPQTDGTTKTTVDFVDGRRAVVATLPPGQSGGLPFVLPDRVATVSTLFDAAGTEIGRGVSSTYDTGTVERVPVEAPTALDYSESFEESARLSGKLEDDFREGPLSGRGLLEGTFEAKVTAHASAAFGSDGASLTAGGEAAVRASGRAYGQLGVDGIGTLTGEIAGSAEVYARALATARLGPDGVRLGFDAEALAAAQVGGKVGLDTGPVDALIEGQFGVGVGLKFSFDAEVSASRVGLDVDAGAALGLAAGYEFDVSVSPKDMIEGIERDPVGALRDSAGFLSGARFDSSGDYVIAGLAASMTGGYGIVSGVVADVAGSIVGTVGDALEDVPVLGEMVDVVSGAVDFVDDAASWVAGGIEDLGEAIVDLF